MRRLGPVVLSLVAILLACEEQSSAATERSSLRDLASLAELKAAFNADAGKPRLVLLLSPT